MLSVVTGSGRCGTHSITYFLNGQARENHKPVVARHETDWQEIVNYLHHGREDLVDKRLAMMPYDIEVSPFLLLMSRPPQFPSGTTIPLVGLIRDARDTVRSGMTNGWYWNPMSHELQWVRLLPHFDGDRFEQCCQYWSWACRRLITWNATIFTVEKLSSEQAERTRLLTVLGLQASHDKLPRENQTSYKSMRLKAAESEAKKEWPAPFPSPKQWGVRRRELFLRHCGEMMDKFYPS